ncbi:hypothetical protein GXV20_004878 [Escherichia coli]|uniref:hypothetical protein n=1 Tax=Escherichia coli TaxID=562 RepID=UPI000BE2217B|nr:hypothetical protein [Escherichia coli]EEV6060040.1 hypothetical protein [Escherichia coli]EFI4430025.1 hypothetical protein [Escherichia coli]EFJ9401917.1 hypothetical protein [Escherichia coli]EFO1660691.1 hypothetical protein [Escherichia coli]EIB0411420.1 hypothetical protein [Escherichia coli]
MDESRKQFEEWFENYTGCDPKNKIYANMLEMYWQAWQASRAAIEIELPESFTMHSGRTPYLYVSEVQSAIRAAGIKVKE